MKDLPRIEAAYNRADLLLDGQRGSADELAAAKIEAEQVLLDQAYFLLCWGQLEIEIDQVCREAIGRRRAHDDWQVRRGWDFYNPDDPRLSGLSFENRTSLVLDRRAGRGSRFALAMRHYETRNLIAHGRLRDTRIDLAAAVQDFYLVQASLHRSR